MRFCATMRRPAFSIIALMAPVTLRAVASGLRIENVRSIDIIYPLRIYGSGVQPRGLIPFTHDPGKRTREQHEWAMNAPSPRMSLEKSAINFISGPLRHDPSDRGHEPNDR